MTNRRIKGKYSGVSIIRISREAKINSTYVFFELQISHWVHKNSIGTKTNSSYGGFRVIKVRVIETLLYINRYSPLRWRWVIWTRDALDWTRRWRSRWRWGLSTAGVASNSTRLARSTGLTDVRLELRLRCGRLTSRHLRRRRQNRLPTWRSPSL